MYALLIGVDCYLDNELPDGSYYPSLGGCVRDVAHIEEFLKSKLGMPDESIFKLTAADTGADEPPEPREKWPTYENMVKAFQHLGEIAQPGDQVCIHYSGHGGRAATVYPELKGETGLDEVLVPTNIGNTEDNYLRDIELAHLLKKMVDKGLVVTIVLDSCHSGGATRGIGRAVKRGINTIDTAVRPQHSLVASPEELAATWKTISGGNTRAVKLGSGWLLEPKGYVLLSACRASESANEFAFEGSERNGALTYWLLDSLKQMGPGLTYKLLHDRILPKVHSQFELQTPQLQGEGNRLVFGSDEVQPHFAVDVLEVKPADKKILLNAGQPQTLRKGVRFAVYPHGTTDFSLLEERLALVEISELGAEVSWAKIIEELRPDPIEQGAQAVLVDVGSTRLQRRVCLAQNPELPAGIDQAGALKEVEKVLQGNDIGFVRLSKEEEPADFQVAVNENSEYEIWDAAGQVIQNLRPALRISDNDAPARVVRRLVHLTKYRNVQELDNHDTMSPLAGKLIVELTGFESSDYDPADKPKPRAFADPGGTPTINIDEYVFIRVKNNLPPGKANDPSRILNVTILDLQPDWGISQVYPAGSGYFEPLDPGQEVVLPLQASLPGQYTEGTDKIKVFATLGTTNFRWLELPSLDQPETRSAVTRGGPANPLEELLRAVAAEKPKTRNVTVAAYPSRGWVTGCVELHVKRT